MKVEELVGLSFLVMTINKWPLLKSIVGCALLVCRVVMELVRELLLPIALQCILALRTENIVQRAEPRWTIKELDTGTGTSAGSPVTSWQSILCLLCIIILPAELLVILISVGLMLLVSEDPISGLTATLLLLAAIATLLVKWLRLV